MKNRIKMLTVLMFAVSFINTQSFDFDRDYRETVIEPRLAEVYQNRRKAAALLKNLENKRIYYEDLQDAVRELGRKEYQKDEPIPVYVEGERFPTWTYPKISRREYRLKDRIQNDYEGIHFPGVLPYVEEALNVENIHEPVPYSQKVPEIKDLVKNRMKQQSLRYKFSRWISKKLGYASPVEPQVFGKSGRIVKRKY